MIIQNGLGPFTLIMNKYIMVFVPQVCHSNHHRWAGFGQLKFTCLERLPAQGQGIGILVYPENSFGC